MTSMITARVDAEKRKSAEKVFSEVGLTTSGAVNLFICAVAMTGGIPFPVAMVGTAAHGMGERRVPDDRRADDFAGGIKVGLADGRFRFREGFDEAFDAMDAEMSALFG